MATELLTQGMVTNGDMVFILQETRLLLTRTGVTAKNFSGDGFTIENNLNAVKKVPYKVKLDRVTADYNRRQGLSIIGGTNIKITNSTFKHTEGTPSSAGIALERDKPYTFTLENVVIRHNRIQNNAGYGLIFTFSHHSRAEYSIIRSNKEGGVFLTVPTAIHCMETKSSATADIS
ncbi:right-handed parallel beta-helix repeat-containing protein [Domibacillus sp.]|uniref:right-handed parallel beta-helix repeat-containing protein n=1 Tax=Domibacillus sp. TaxID=1969783 RepID=UPI0028111CA3|nr:right-handed parallel beta-helix repeat-containing protein [Domibacillus sp.]